MLSKRVGDVPDRDGWIFEPKWDGFRTLIFLDGNEITIQSRDETWWIISRLIVTMQPTGDGREDSNAFEYLEAFHGAATDPTWITR